MATKRKPATKRSSTTKTSKESKAGKAQLKRGRPNIDKPLKTVGFRLSQGTFDSVKRLAKKSGVTMTAYMRSAIELQLRTSKASSSAVCTAPNG